MTTTAGARSHSARGAGRAAAGGSRLRWMAAAVLITGALMDLIDVTIVNVALPTIRRNLDASATQLEWVVSGYLLAFAAILIIAGSLGDRFGRKRLFLAGVGVFGAASLAAGLSGTAAELIAARVVQGAGAAMMAPQVLATFRVIFSGRERGKAFALYGAMAGFASAIGLALGGVLTDANLFGWSWRAVFFVNVPVALVTLAAGLRLVPPTRDPAAGRPDLPAAVLAGGLVAIVYPLLGGPPARLAGLDLAVDDGRRRRGSGARGAGGKWPPDAAGPGLPGRHGGAAAAAAFGIPAFRRRVRRAGRVRGRPAGFPAHARALAAGR
jgi:MFS family permease